MQIKLYYMPQTRAFRVRWLLEELGLDYTLEHMNLFNGETETAAYKAVHPLGHLPAIEVDGKTLFESGAICAWFADQFPEKNLAPAIDTLNRSEYEQWMYFVPGEVEPPLFYFLLHNRILPAGMQIKEILPWLQARYVEVLKALENKLTNQQYLVGNHFSAADIMLGSTINWLPELLEPFAELQKYIARLSHRDAYIAAMQSR